MSTRDHAPIGAPCWTDLWTSDVEVSRDFYSRLFGWEAHEPSPEFGGYFMFTNNEVAVAGAMGDMGEMKANDTWKIYFCTNDINALVKRGESKGAQFMGPPMPVADLGVQVVFNDPSGAALGEWQPESFQGFVELEANATPSWFELHTNDFAGAISFYEDVLGVNTVMMSDTDEFRYATIRCEGSQIDSAGIMDARSFLGADGASYWTTYWEVDDIDETVAKLVTSGGSVLEAPIDTPYGRMSTVADPQGARFRLRTGPGLS